MKVSKYTLSSETAQLAILGQFDISMKTPYTLVKNQTVKASVEFQPELANMPLEYVTTGNENLSSSDKEYNQGGSVYAYGTPSFRDGDYIAVEATLKWNGSKIELALDTSKLTNGTTYYTKQKTLRAFGYVFKSPFEP